MRSVAAVFLLLVTAPLARAQSAPLAFTRVEGEGDRASFVIYAIARDATGYLWAGTQNGLNRYDGVRARTFGLRAAPPDSTASTELPDPDVVALAPDAGVPGGMWVGTRAGGLARYDPRTEQFARYTADPGRSGALPADSVRALLTDRSGVLWVGTTGGGLAWRARGAAGFERVRGLGGQVTVRALVEAAPGTVWAGTPHGLVRLDARGGAATALPLGPGLEGNVTALAVAGGAVWATTAGGVLYRVEVATGRVTPFRPGGTPGVALAALAASRVRPGVLWVGTRGQGLLAFDTQTGRAAPATADPTLARADVLALDEDAAGLLWMGTIRGLYQADAAGPRFTPVLNDPARRAGRLTGNGVMALYEAPSEPGVVWVGTVRGGFDRYDRRTRAVRAYFEEPGHPLNVVFAIHEDGAGQLWLGGEKQEALYRFDRATGNARAYPLAPGSRGIVKAIYEAPSRPGVLWVAPAAGGLVEFDPARGAVLRRFTTAGPPGARLPSNDVWAVLELADEPGVLWVGTDGGGLARLDVATGAVRRVEAADGCQIGDRVVAVAAGPGPLLWLGTFDEGLIRYDRRAGTCRRYTRADGLPSDAVAAVFVHEGLVWVSTTRGLARLDPVRGAVTTFTEADGLQGETFYIHARGRTAAGELLLGGEGGFNVFHPDHVRVDTTAPRVVLTRVLIDGRPYPLVREGDGFRPITLRYDQHDVAFEFAALDLRAPSMNRYRVGLDGAGEGGWEHLGTQAAVRYPYLEPGRYVFRVSGTNADGYWSRGEAGLAFVIRPPIMQTWWFRVLVGVLALVLVGGGIWYRIREVRRLERARARERARERELEQAKQIERAYTELKATQAQLVQAEKLASLGRLTSGIAHEIKNPLNFVNNFSALSAELLDELEAELEAASGRPVAEAFPELAPLLDDLRANAAKIHEHGQRADAIVGGMMQHARGRTEARRRVEVNALVREHVGLAREGWKEGGHAGGLPFEVVLDLAADAGWVEAAPGELGQVVENLVANALYAVAEKAREDQGIGGNGAAAYVPTVTVRTRWAGGQVEVAVEDNGVGLPAGTEERIFEPFYTTKPTGRGNVGLGLSLSHDIVVGHGGTLRVEHGVSEGATFVVTLPAA